MMSRVAPPSRPRRAPVAGLATIVGVAAALLIATLALPRPTPAASAAPAQLPQARSAAASSTENAGTPASAAIDGDLSTRWSSAFPGGLCWWARTGGCAPGRGPPSDFPSSSRC